MEQRPALRRQPLGRPLGRAFYSRHAAVVARALLGRLLVFDGPDGRSGGVIVETEAYRGRGDPASHGHRGRTPRNAVMFGPAGHAYVYFIYGMHFCLNVVTEGPSIPGAVLLRAMEPELGIERMRARRGEMSVERLARGPGSLARALGLGREHDGLDLTRGPLWISDRAPRRSGRAVLATGRVGIRVAAERRWRFVLAGHPCASGPRAPGRPGDPR